MIRYVAMAAEKIVNLKDKKSARQEEPFPAISTKEPIIAWNSRDHIPQEHSFLWYAGLTIIAILLIIWAIWTFNFLFAVFIFAATITLFAASVRPVATYQIKVFPQGIEIEGLPMLPFADIESFWIFPDTTPAMLMLRPRRHIKLPTYLLLENVDAEKVREVLLNYIPEREEEFPFSERISNWLGF
jgi:hypothetical protein